jgi:hypothetical protein
MPERLIWPRPQLLQFDGYRSIAAYPMEKFPLAGRFAVCIRGDINLAHPGVSGGGAIACSRLPNVDADAEWPLRTTLERRSEKTRSVADYLNLISEIQPAIETFTGQQFSTRPRWAATYPSGNTV